MEKGEQNVCMIGVGGMGMCPLAIYLRQAGYRVIGYDDALQETVKQMLIAEGVELIGRADSLPMVDCVIYSSAIAPQHLLYKQAKEKGVPLVRRGEYLAKVLKNKKLIAIVGSHGKTSTTALLIHALRTQGFSFSYLLGALFKEKNCLPANYIDAEWVVAEVDESDGTIEHFSPEITLAVNFDWDHPDKYSSPEDLINTFKRLFGRTRGAIFYPSDCEILKKIVGELSIQEVSFGKGGAFDAGITEEDGRLLIGFQGLLPNSSEMEDRSVIEVPLSGEFNGKNAMAAVAIVQYLVGEFKADVFKDYLGVQRRQEVLFEANGLNVLMDYAHHPTEIQALLDCARKKWKDAKLIVVFQPHRYTRTKQYYQLFAEVLGSPDQLILMPVYAASEPYDVAGTSELIYTALEDSSKTIFLKSFDDDLHSLLPSLDSCHSQASVVLFVGAGDIEKKAKSFQKYLREMDFKKKAQDYLSNDTHLIEYEPLADKTTMRVGGKARFYAEPASLEDLIALLKLCTATKTPFFILGRGSNLIVADAGFDGLVMRLNQPYWKTMERLEGNRLWANAGVRLKEICGAACKWGFSGFEFLEGIPGTLGGSLRMNAGAMGGWLFDIVESVRFLGHDGEVVEREVSELKLGYRFCRELESAIALGAVLKSPFNQDTVKITEVIEDFAKKRKRSQPREPSAGCIFKNPAGNYAGKLIEEAGLKGKRVGGAEVSAVHANFIINKAEATSKDIVNLIEFIKNTVKEKSNVELETEVLFLGD